MWPPKNDCRFQKIWNFKIYIKKCWLKEKNKDKIHVITELLPISCLLCWVKPECAAAGSAASAWAAETWEPAYDDPGYIVWHFSPTGPGLVDEKFQELIPDFP